MGTDNNLSQESNNQPGESQETNQPVNAYSLLSFLKLSIGTLLIGLTVILLFLVIPDGSQLHTRVFRYLLDINFADNGLNLSYKLSFYSAFFASLGILLLVLRKFNYYQTATKLLSHGIFVVPVIFAIISGITGELASGGELVVFAILFFIGLNFVYLAVISLIFILLSYIFEKNQKKDLNLIVLLVFAIIASLLIKFFFNWLLV